MEKLSLKSDVCFSKYLQMNLQLLLPTVNLKQAGMTSSPKIDEQSFPLFFNPLISP